MKKSGFTLVELMIVIVVLGVLLGLVIPRLGELSDANLKRSARHLTGMIRYLRDESQAKKAVYRLRFDVQNGHYWAEQLMDVTLPTGEHAVEFRRFGSDIGTEGSLSGETAFRDVHVASHPDDPFILFTPDGWVESALLHLKDGQEHDFTLIVKPLMGATELREGYVEEK